MEFEYRSCMCELLVWIVLCDATAEDQRAQVGDKGGGGENMAQDNKGESDPFYKGRGGPLRGVGEGEAWGGFVLGNNSVNPGIT